MLSDELRRGGERDCSGRWGGGGQVGGVGDGFKNPPCSQRLLQCQISRDFNEHGAYALILRKRGEWT